MVICNLKAIFPFPLYPHYAYAHAVLWISYFFNLFLPFVITQQLKWLGLCCGFLSFLFQLFFLSIFFFFFKRYFFFLSLVFHLLLFTLYFLLSLLVYLNWIRRWNQGLRLIHGVLFFLFHSSVFTCLAHVYFLSPSLILFYLTILTRIVV